jgi:hypothetical protein
MRDVESLERAGTNAVKRLRVSKLKHGNPFMINSRELPADQCYLEFPDGKIVLVTFSRSTLDFTPLRELSYVEGSALRRKFNLEVVTL